MGLLKVKTKFQEALLLVLCFAVPSAALLPVLWVSTAHERLMSLLGQGGFYLAQLGSDLFGAGMFVLAPLMAYMGFLVILRFQNMKELWEHRGVLRDLVGFATGVFVIVSAVLASLQQGLGLAQSSHYGAGLGGMIGELVGGTLTHYLGILGSLAAELMVVMLIGLATGHFQFVNTLLKVEEVSFDVVQGVQNWWTQKMEARRVARAQVLRSEEHHTSYVPTQLIEIDASVMDLRQAAGAERSNAGAERPETRAERPETRAERPETRAERPETRAERANNRPELSLVPLSDEQIEAESAEKQSQAKSLKKVGKAAAVKINRRKSSSKRTVITEEILEPSAHGADDFDSVDINPDAPVALTISTYKKKYEFPTLNLLEKAKARKGLKASEIQAKAKKLTERLASFGVPSDVVAIHPGARLTLFELQPHVGVKISKLQAISNDLALLLGASSLRILAPIPGKNTVGIEVPNPESEMVRFAEFFEPLHKKSGKMRLPVALGLDVHGEVLVGDLADMPHLLVAGTTGSGKSVFVNTLITSLIATRSPQDLRFVMVDPKMIELSPYNGIPHLLEPVISDVSRAKDILQWAEREMDLRYQQFSDVGARNIDSFNEKISKLSKKCQERRAGKALSWNWERMPYIVIVVDEMADLMITQGKEVEIPITRIAQKARACGIHLVLSTQRPSAEIVTGLIKTNFPTRVAFKVSSSLDSRTILDSSGAEKLLGNGDMLLMPNGKALQRLQASYLSEAEVNRVVESIS